MKDIQHIFSKLLALCGALLLLLPCASCKKINQQENEPAKTRKVLLLYADGYNNLPGYMTDDVKDLGSAAPKEYLRDRYSVLVFKHFAEVTAGLYDYRKKVHPVLTELYRDADGNVITDTVKIYPDTMTTSSIHGLREVLEDVKTMYPAVEYGLVYSSHGTGWVPEEYYDNYEIKNSSAHTAHEAAGHPSITGRIDLLYEPLVKSMGCQAYYDKNTLRTKEIDVRQLQNAFPMHLKYLILDACLMGGAETAYQLRHVTEKLIFSACEVPAGGFDYKNLPDRVLYPVVHDFKAVCDDYSKMHSSHTVALVDCASLEDLAAACRTLFGKYSSAMAGLKASDVQRFYRGYHPWYFDLRDMMVKAKASEEDLATLDEALSCCIEYKLNSNSFMGDISLKTYCGLSMYMPSVGNSELNSYYLGYDWNTVTDLINAYQ